MLKKNTYRPASFLAKGTASNYHNRQLAAINAKKVRWGKKSRKKCSES